MEYTVYSSTYELNTIYHRTVQMQDRVLRYPNFSLIDTCYTVCIYNVIQQHVHVHILPRKAGDFLNNDDIYKEVS